MYVYIAANKKNKVLYTGVTNDILRRMYEHKSGSIEGFTKDYNINKLLFYEEIKNPQDAIMLEKRIKKFCKADKLRLIYEKNPELKDLSEDWEFGELGHQILYMHYRGSE